MAEAPTPVEGLSQKEFERFLKGLQLQDLRVRKVAAESFGKGEPEGTQYDFGFDAELVEVSDHSASIDVVYGVRVRTGDEGALQAHLEVCFRVDYLTETMMTRPIFEQFMPISLRVQTLPFAREWFRDASGRMGLSPILLPIALAQPMVSASRKRQGPKQ